MCRKKEKESGLRPSLKSEDLCVCVCMYVCVYVRDRERGRERARETEAENMFS